MLSAQTIVCEVFEVENLETDSKYKSDATMEFFKVNTMLYTLTKKGVIPFKHAPDSDGVADSGVKYKTYVNTLGDSVAVYNDFKEGVYTYTKDLTEFKILTDCRPTM